MLLEGTLSGYSTPHDIGLFDASSQKSPYGSKLISAMLAERPFQTRGVSSVHSSHSNTSAYAHNSILVNDSSSFNMEKENLNQYKASQGEATSLNSETESRSSKASVVPTCVVSPSENDRDYRSTDEESMSQYGPEYIPIRKQREFIPDNKKDDGYWEKRRKNNEAARRSREKRRINDMELENRIMELTRENCKLQNELMIVKKKCGLSLEDTLEGDEPEMNNTGASSGNINQNGSFSGTTDHSELQPRYSVAMPQSPVTNRNISGSCQSPHTYSYLPGNATPQNSPLKIFAESFYMHRAQREPGINPSSKSFENENQFQLKSIINNSHMSQIRVDNRLHPAYSSALPPNTISPYNLSLPVSSQKSCWNPTTDMASSDSNDERDWNDEVQEHPLSLVTKRHSTENESSSDMFNFSSGTSNSPPSSSALPLKLRHKVSQDSSPVGSPNYPTFQNRLVQNGLIQNRLVQPLKVTLARSGLVVPSTEEQEIQSSYKPMISHPGRSVSNLRSPYDVQYVERQRKNNEAARKCRENRNHLTTITEMKSGYLESENNQLKDELFGLHEGVRELRDMLEKKQKKRAVAASDNEQDNECHPKLTELETNQTKLIKVE